MKKYLVMLTLLGVAFLAFNFVDASECRVYLPLIYKPAETFVPDCQILKMEMIKDSGPVGDFRLTLNFAQLPSGNKIATGKPAYGGAWIDYLVGSDGTLVVTGWPQGDLFEFNYGITKPDQTKKWEDPSCSRFKVSGHLGITLGEKRNCSGNLNDVYVVGVTKIQSEKYKLFLNYTDFRLKNFQQLAARGQSVPNGAWKDYVVQGTFPCYYIVINWPDDGGKFHFNFWIVKEDGSKQWSTPSLSEYYCSSDGLLCLNPKVESEK